MSPSDRIAPTSDPVARSPHVHPLVELVSAYAWRLIVMAVALVGVLWLVGQLLVVVLPVVAATLLTVALVPVARTLRRRGAPPLVATWGAMLGFLGALALVGSFIVPAITAEFGDLGTTVEEGIDKVEQWLVDDAPFEVSQTDLDDAREQINDAARAALNNSGGAVREGAVIVGEIVVGLILSFVLTFFFIKDGEKFQAWCLRRLPEHQHDRARRMASKGWASLGGYLRGSATLGVIEGIIIGTAVWVVGGALAVPVAVITFVAAFVPLVGAVTAGIVAILVTLVTAGPVPALIVAAVALVVQQLDNDLLAPFVFGNALDLHPVVILLVLTGGTALFGFVGTVLAVPVTAVIVNALRAAPDPGPDPPPHPDGEVPSPG